MSEHPNSSLSVVEEDTVESLKAELRKTQEKFSDWRLKTKSGVDQLREQVVQLTEELKVCKSQLQARKAAAHGEGEDRKTSDERCDMVESSTLAVDALGMIFADFTLKKSFDVIATWESTLRSQIAAVQANFDKYRKRAEQSIKISSSQQESLIAETKELRGALDRAIEELRVKDNAIEQRNLAVASLEKQLDAAFFSVESLRAEAQERQLQAQSMMPDTSCGETGGSPSTTGPLVPLGEVEVELERVRAEFGERENVLHQVHRSDMERLMLTHELETQQLVDELTERHKAEVLQLQAQFDQSMIHSTPQAQENDEAYLSLMKERDALAAASKEKDGVIAALRRQLTASTSSVATTNSHSMREDHPRRIQDLERQVASLTDQLWSANNAVLESKALRREATAVSCKPSAGSSTLDAPPQASAYLRSIVVKLLCEKHDEVKANLVPVLTTLLQLDTADLRAIFTSNPSWVKS